MFIQWLNKKNKCLDVCQSDSYLRLLAVCQSHGSPYGHADWLWRVLPAVFIHIQ